MAFSQAVQYNQGTQLVRIWRMLIKLDKITLESNDENNIMATKHTLQIHYHIFWNVLFHRTSPHIIHEPCKEGA